MADGRTIDVSAPTPTSFSEVNQTTGLPTGNAARNPRNFATTWSVKPGSTPWPAGFGEAPTDPLWSDRKLDWATKYTANNGAGWDNNVALRFYKASSPVGINSTTIVPFTLVPNRTFTYDALVQMWILTSNNRFEPSGPPELVATNGACVNPVDVSLTIAGSRVSN